MQPPKQYTAKLEDKVAYTDKYIHYAFEFTEPHTMDFMAGQYVSIKVSEKGERRSYSIASSPGINHGIELLLDISPQGVGSKYLEALKFGDTVSFLGPLGLFVIQEKVPETELFFIATGSGIAPFRSMIQDLLQEKQDKRPMTLYWGLRYETDMFWETEFQELAESFSNFTFKIILSKPSDAWKLSRGRVTDLLTVVEKSAGVGYYLCGSGPMVKDVIQQLADAGVPTQNVHNESFY